MAEAPKLCSSCREAMNEYTAALHRERAAQLTREGRCARCGQRKAVRGRTLCRGCQADQARRSRESYARRYEPKGTTSCSNCGRTGHNRVRCPSPLRGGAGDG